MIGLCIGLVALLSIVMIVGVVSCCIIGGRADDRMNKMTKREVE